jgi:phosphoglycerate kinase
MSLRKLLCKDYDLRNQTVVVRVDFNCPLDKQRRVRDNSRIQVGLQTINYLLTIEGVKIVLMSHFGHPNGNAVPEFSLRPVYNELVSLLKDRNVVVKFAPDCMNAVDIVKSLNVHEICLLENLRYSPDEESNGPELAKILASYGTFYINDAFGSANRVYASNVGITKYFKGRSACGFLLGKEVLFLDLVTKFPVRPFVGIVGGAKITEKFQVVANLVTKVDKLIIGGGMAYTFLRAKGKNIGQSLMQVYI